jgi:hypothetical protein
MGIRSPTPAEAETKLRMTLRHVRVGRACIAHQIRVLATLRGKGLPTGEAVAVLAWLEETQRLFEDYYRNLHRRRGGDRVEGHRGRAFRRRGAASFFDVEQAPWRAGWFGC